MFLRFVESIVTHGGNTETPLTGFGCVEVHPTHRIVMAAGWAGLERLREGPAEVQNAFQVNSRTLPGSIHGLCCEDMTES